MEYITYQIRITKKVLNYNYVNKNKIVNNRKKYSQEQIDNLKSIRTTKIYHNNAMFKSFIDGTIHSAEHSTVDKKALEQFFTYNDELDNARASRLNDYIPMLEQLRIHVDKSGDI